MYCAFAHNISQFHNELLISKRNKTIQHASACSLCGFYPSGRPAIRFMSDGYVMILLNVAHDPKQYKLRKEGILRIKQSYPFEKLALVVQFYLFHSSPQGSFTQAQKLRGLCHISVYLLQRIYNHLLFHIFNRMCLFHIARPNMFQR